MLVLTCPQPLWPGSTGPCKCNKITSPVKSLNPFSEPHKISTVNSLVSVSKKIPPLPIAPDPVELVDGAMLPASNPVPAVPSAMNSIMSPLTFAGAKTIADAKVKTNTSKYEQNFVD